MRTREERQTHAQRRPNKINQNLNLIIHSLGNCRQSQTSSDISWRSVNSRSGKLKSASCLVRQLLVRLTKSCQNKQHFLVYQSLNSLVSRDFLLDVLSFLLAVVSVSLVLKNSNKPINRLIHALFEFTFNQIKIHKSLGKTLLKIIMLLPKTRLVA